MSSIARLAFAALMGLALTGCMSGSDNDAYYEPAPPRMASAAALPEERGTNHVETRPGQVALQCVPYAREHSAIKITGDAYTWWDKAAGRYERGPSPATGTVMVLFNYAGPQHGHVAVVRRLVSAREIRIDHANWLNDGSIYVNNPVVDVSAANDWSQIRVWNIKTGGWGAKIFPVQGFIGPGSNTGSTPRGDDDEAPGDLIASADPETVLEEAPQPVMTAAVKPRTAARPAAVRTANPFIPVALTGDGRNPAPDSGFALTADDLAMH